jgi:hypothetical protein
MSIQNRFLNEGNHKVIKENRFQNILAKLHCLIFGHMSVRFDVDSDIKNKRYCLCCWKELKKK